MSCSANMENNMYSMTGYGKGIAEKDQRKITSLRKKINDINDAIKMREKHLSARGVSFKEYK